MKIFYNYEISGREKTTQRQCIEITTECPCISYEQLLGLLRQEQVKLNANSAILYFDYTKNIYVSLKHGEVLPTSEEIKILIRHGHSSQITDLLHKLESLEHQVQSLEEKLEQKEKELQSLPDSLEPSPKSSYSELDIAMLHAAPLVYIKNSEIIAYEEPSLDFEQQKQFFIENITRAADIRFEAATSENFDELLEDMPKIIIVSCESFYNNNGELVLAFEKHELLSADRGEVGLLSELTAAKLKQMLLAANQYSQVIIVKGRQSQEIGKVFLNAGFSCVITVHDIGSETKSFRFISNICNNLLSGDIIEHAYYNVIGNEGKEGVYEFNDYICCCAHQHKPGCLWVEGNNIHESCSRHLAHSSDNCCKLGGSLHKFECVKVESFYKKYNIALKEELKQEYVLLCCCSPEIDHMNIKYSILYNDASILDQSLFETHKKGKLEVRSALSAHLRPSSVQKFTIGRRKEIRDVILKLLSSRCVNITGESGCGKTMVAKRVAQYAYERRIFKDGVVYLDFMMRTDIIFLYRYIANTLNLPIFDSYEALCSIINELDVLLIIDNIDPLLRHYKDSIITTYTSILTNTSKPKFLISSHSKLNLKESRLYELPCLSLPEASHLLSYLSCTSEISPQLLKTIGTKPSDLQQISPLIALPNLEELIKAAEGDSPTCLIVSLNYLKTKTENPQEFLKLLSYLPSGAFIKNIEYLCKERIKNYEEILEVLKNASKGTGIWFIHMDKRNNFMLLRSTVMNYFESSVEVNIELVKSIVLHLAVFSRAILKAFLYSPGAIGAEPRSSLLYVNAGIENGIWQAWNNELSTEIASAIKDPDLTFTKFEANFWYYLEVNTLKSLLNTTESLEPQIAEALGEIILSTTAIFILLGKSFDALEMIQRGHQCCKAFQLKRTKSLLQLTEASLKAIKGEFSSAFDLVETSKKFFYDSEEQAGQAECHLLKGLMKEMIESKNELIFIRRNTNANDIDSELGIAIHCFEQSEQHLGSARAYLAYAEYKLKNESNESEIERMLKTAVDEFGKCRTSFWETRARICLSDWYYHGHNWVVSREILTSIVPQNKDVGHEIIIAEKLRKINDTIRKTKKHVISLFKSFPIVEKSQNDQMNRAGAIWRHSSTFRGDLHTKLANTHKELCIRMDIASKEKFTQYLSDKSLILHISSDVVSSNHLVLEGPKGIAEAFTFQEFSDLVGGSLKSHGVELLVFAMPLTIKLGQYCYDHLHVKHVVCFNFLDYPRDGIPAQIFLTMETAIHEFCIEFYIHIVNGKSIRNAFTEAKGTMEKFIETRASLFKNLQIRGKSFETWWEEYHKNEPVLINESSADHDECLLSADSTEGSFIEMNNPRGPCNIYRKSLNMFVGRQVETYNVLNALEEAKCVHIFGERGIGKTEFVSQVGYFLNVRNFYSDGIFLLDLKGISSLNEVYMLLKDVGLAFYSSDIAPSSFLYQRKLLLILDNCEDLYCKAAHTFHSLLSMFLIECKISVIFTTSIQIQAPENYNIKRFALRSLRYLESSVVLAINSPTFTSHLQESQEENQEYEEAISEIIKKCKGLPKKLIKWANKMEKLKPNKILQILMVLRMNGEIPDTDERKEEENFKELALRRRSRNFENHLEANS